MTDNNDHDAAPPPLSVNGQARPPELIGQMSDREIAEETLGLLRALVQVFSALGNNPMLSAFIPASVRGKLG